MVASEGIEPTTPAFSGLYDQPELRARSLDSIWTPGYYVNSYHLAIARAAPASHLTGAIVNGHRHLAFCDSFQR